MKKLLLLLPAIFLLYGCEEVRRYDYTIENNSGVTVEFIPYTGYHSDLDYDSRVILENGKKLNRKYSSTTPPYGYSFSEVLFGHKEYRIAAIEIVFDNKKKVLYKRCTLEYSCNEDPRSIFNNVERNKDLVEVYTITPEDYNNAIPCNNNCY